MKKWNRLLGAALSGMMLLVLAACGQQDTQQPDMSSSQGQESQPSESGPAGQTPTEGSDPASSSPTVDSADSKILVVYYSATGNTEAVAGYIENAIGGDLFEIVPAEPYTSDDLDWNDENSRVNQEHENEALREVALAEDTAPNWETYDTVFIGYPIWWGIAAWPVDSFIGANDFTGKTVIPFCTSTSSGLGQSAELLEELAGTGTWQEGYRFSEQPTQSDVESWVNGLGLPASTSPSVNP